MFHHICNYYLFFRDGDLHSIKLLKMFLQIYGLLSIIKRIEY